MSRWMLALVMAGCSERSMELPNSPFAGEEVPTAFEAPDADPDADRLTTLVELQLGTDPELWDTDGDSYGDGDEVYEQTDPLDAASRIYEGYWPYYFEKTELEGNGGERAEPGKRFAHLQMVDQFGDVVDLYDFYDSEKPVVVSLVAWWCPRGAIELNAYLQGDPESPYRRVWPAGPEVIARGDVRWITVIGEDTAGQPDGSGATAAAWAEDYPLDGVAVLEDPDYISADYVNLAWWPFVVLLEPTLELAPEASDGLARTVVSELAERFPN